jgi:hypothetical protein
MFQRIHRDAYTAVLGVLILAGLIAVMLAVFNPVQ